MGIDETSLKRGQDYITVVHDLDEKRLLFATPGRDHATVERLAVDLQAQGCKRTEITNACIDMSAAFAKGIAKSLPNARATRVKLLVHDGFGVWCASRRLNVGRFEWPREQAASAPLALTQAQFDALVVGLPWRRLPEMSVITRA